MRWECKNGLNTQHISIFLKKELFFDFYSAIREKPASEKIEDKIEFIASSLEIIEKAKNLFGKLGDKGEFILSKSLDLLIGLGFVASATTINPTLLTLVATLKGLKSNYDQNGINEKITTALDHLSKQGEDEVAKPIQTRN